MAIRFAVQQHVPTNIRPTKLNRAGQARQHVCPIEGALGACPRWLALPQTGTDLYHSRTEVGAALHVAATIIHVVYHDTCLLVVY